MLKHLSRARLIGAWFAAVAVIFACSVVVGAPLTMNASGLWLVACLVPPAVMLLVWPGAQPATVAELLYSVDTTEQDRHP